ncbi:membrane hypothetical protein [Thiomonas sp. X19]|uniref:hypothetical protein n=1 Tax=Thiomonas sp. X19 TaxID=1050370 RepID=UPI000B729585|nr:hypothetical protein [Thiomonas sp. X19]SCC91910.1 membrane hypothetical protein [Thiomonas sp. X19]
MPANPYARDLRKVSDPLKDETRKVRKTLLVWCLAAAAITLGHLFPSEIAALGMKVTPANHAALLLLMAAIITYHLLAFLVYASADFAYWYVNHRSTEWEDDSANYEVYKAELLSKAKLSEEDRQFMEEHERRLGSQWRGEPVRIYMRVQTAIPYLSVARALVDFLLPVLAGGAALYLLVVAARGAL